MLVILLRILMKFQGPKYIIPHTWGDAKSTWRNDQLTSIDVAYMNHREILYGDNNLEEPIFHGL